MRIGVLGTGSVGQAIATRLTELGHEVTMGARDATNPKAAAWTARLAASIRADEQKMLERILREIPKLADAVVGAEVVVNATAGTTSVEAFEAAGGNAALAGKVVLDVSNPIDWSTGELVLTVVNTDSVGERLQRALPDAQVVKSLNTVNASVMVHPGLVPGEHTMFVSGDHATAKDTVTRLLRDFGWPAGSIVDLGGITAARGQEMYIVLWVSLMQVGGGGPAFNIHVVRDSA
jgi:predicted dinucleotide-binding enzyme